MQFSFEAPRPTASVHLDVIHRCPFEQFPHLLLGGASSLCPRRQLTVCFFSDPGWRATTGNLEKLLPLPIADSLGANVNESERERSGIIRRQFCGVRRVEAIFRGALMLTLRSVCLRSIR